MAGELVGAYRAVVVSNDDPGELGRVFVQIADLGSNSWATPSEAPGKQGVARALPAVGETVFVQFEHGDADHPVYEGGHVTGAAPAAATGTYRAMVLDHDDPDQWGRVLVSVPDLDVDGTWAMPSESPDVQGLHRELPAVGAEVWVEFERGDRDHPIYQGGRVLADATAQGRAAFTLQGSTGAVPDVTTTDGGTQLTSTASVQVGVVARNTGDAAAPPVVHVYVDDRHVHSEHGHDVPPGADLGVVAVLPDALGAGMHHVLVTVEPSAGDDVALAVTVEVADAG